MTNTPDNSWFGGWESAPTVGPMSVNADGVLTEVRLIGGQEVIVHYDDVVPESDFTTVDGIPVTTPVRTLIDLAPDVDQSHLDAMVDDVLARGLATEAEARARIAQPDIRNRVGAKLLRSALDRRHT
ncbi:MAG TPA: hypothetical protein VHA73_14010 [Acidimicrobiales bacterium]|jgi:hypothetical protein|nr:hypothetical protein [Acidimicrobiales bacterium]